MAEQPEHKKAGTHKGDIQVIVGPVSVAGQTPWFREGWLLGLVLCFTVLVTYAQVWQAEFIWDDDKLLTANPSMVGLHGLISIWTTRAADICPLVLTTFWMEHALS